jgi:hypothetical protein
LKIFVIAINFNHLLLINLASWSEISFWKLQRKWAGGGSLQTNNWSGRRWNFGSILKTETIKKKTINTIKHRAEPIQSKRSMLLTWCFDWFDWNIRSIQTMMFDLIDFIGMIENYCNLIPIKGSFSKKNFLDNFDMEIILYWNPSA